MYLHDPVSFVAVVRPDLFTYKKGVVRVETQGICVGHTLMDQGLKRFISLQKRILFESLILSLTGGFLSGLQMEREQSVGGIFTGIGSVDGKRRRSIGIYQRNADEAIKDDRVSSVRQVRM